VEEYTKSF
jgi:hypothetical protein